MNIQVRVLGNAAQAQIKALQAQVAQLQGQLSSANAVAANPNGIGSRNHVASLQKWGNQLQWTGRQLQYNWTLPLLLAGGAAAKFSLDNEKAFTHISKVYGDTAAASDFFMRKHEGMSRAMANTKAAEVFRQELGALQEAFVELSSHYGVAQKEVLETAGAWAAAGQSGVALAKSTELSIQASIIGNMDLAKSTESLIAIQSQYSKNTDELRLVLADLNAIENQTGISMEGLIDGFARSAGVAREAGVDVRQLGALLAALVPATGSAAQAGNALKTIFSRLMSPTQEASQVMKEMGLNIKSMDWQGATAVERLKMMSKEFRGLSDSQKQVASSVIASRWQINKFNVLMRELGPRVTYYEKALDATAKSGQAFSTMQKELNAVLESNPKRLEQIWYSLQNGLADAIQPMIPYIIYLANVIRQMVEAFTNLDPSLQKFILLSAFAVAAIGPLIRYFGSLMTLIWALALPLRLLHKNFSIFGHRLIEVDGEMQRVRRGVFATIGAFIAWPFRMIAAGIGAIIGALGTLARMTGLSAAVARGFAALGPIVLTVLRGALLAPLLAVATNAMFALESVLVRGGLASASAFGMALARVAGTAALIFSALGLAIRTALTRIALIFINWGAATVGISSGFYATWLAITARFSRVFTALWVALSGGISMIWTLTYVRLAAITTAFSLRIGAIHAALSARLLLIVQALGARWAAMWAAIHAGLMAISRVFWTGMVRMWVAGMLLLSRTPLLLLRGLRIIWANIAMAAALYGRQILAAFTGPWGIAIAAVLAVVLAFRKQIVQVWNNLVDYFADSSNAMTQAVLKAWYSLPQGVANALTAVARIVRDAALAIYEWFSYINPFAHHSPSLVENVTNGMARIVNEFAKLGAIKQHIMGAYSAIKQFGKAVANITNGAASFEAAQDRAKIKKFAPGALASYDRMLAILKVLNRDLATLGDKVRAQEAVVARWKARLDEANNALDTQQDKLSRLQDTVSKYQDKLDAANARLQRFAETPIVGMRAMEDAIFDNEMAQKRLRLEMLKLGAGTNLDELRNKMAMLQGEAEKLAGERSDLRNAGAGSEITKVYDEQIAAMQAQQKAIEDQSKPLQEMQDQLAELQRQAEIMDLEKSLKFDPLTRAIELAVNAMEEMPFDKIMAGIRDAQADIDLYSQKVKEASAAVVDQQKVVDEAAAARDRISAAMEREQAQLDAIKDKYSQVEQAIRDIEAALNDVANAAGKMEEAAKAKKGKGDYVSPGLQNFRDAAGGNFAGVGGAGLPIRKDWSSELPDIKEFTAGLSKQTSDMFAKLNPFTAIKEKWNEFKGWMGDRWADFKQGFKDMFTAAFAGLGFGSLKDKWRTFTTWLSDKWSSIWDGIKKIGELFLPDWNRIVEAFKSAGKKIWKDLGPELEKFKPVFDNIGKAAGYLWDILEPILGVLGGAFLLVIKVAASILTSALGPAFETIIDVVKRVIQIVRGVVELIVGIFSGDLTMVWQGIKDIVGGLVGGIIELVENLGKVLVGIIDGLVHGIVEFFQWLYDILVGHSIIPDLVDAIINILGGVWDTIKRLWEAGWGAVVGFFMGAWENLKSSMQAAWQWIKDVAGAVWSKVKEAWEATWGAIKDFFSERWETLKGNMKAAWDWIKDVAGAVWTKVKEAWGETWGAIKDFFSEKWENLKGNMKASWDWIKDVAGAVWTKVKEAWGETWGALKSFFSEKWENLKGNLKDAWDWVKNTGGSIWDKVKEGWRNSWEGLKDIVSGPVEWIKGKIEDLKNAFEGIKDKAASLNPFSGGFNFHFAAGGVVPFASGGSVPTRSKNSGPFSTSSPVALVGEGSRQFREFVIPTDPSYRNRARELWLTAGRDLGMFGAGMTAFASGGITGPTMTSGLGAATGGIGSGAGMIWTGDAPTTINIYGNLEFPNIRSDSDAEDFIANLENLVG